MKYVRKGGAPHDYRDWRKQVAGTVDETYRRLRNPEKASVHQSLLREQGWLCAYTMQEIDESCSHIEHVKPEHVCRAEQDGADLNYDNLVACFPREGMRRQYRYGAQQKDDWWENHANDFVSPLQGDCEICFRFSLEGEVRAVRRKVAAENTIRVLGLNHESLMEDRRRVIQEFVYGQDGCSPLSITEASRAARRICSRDGRRRFHVFCVAVGHALQEHFEALGKLAARRRHSRR